MKQPLFVLVFLGVANLLAGQSIRELKVTKNDTIQIKSDLEAGFRLLDEYQWTGSRNMFKRALSHSKLVGYKWGEVKSYYGLGVRYLNLHQFDSSHYQLNLALETARKYHLKQLEVDALNGIGTALAETSSGGFYFSEYEAAKALDALGQARFLAEVINYKKGICESYIYAGRVYLEMKSPATAITMYQKALVMSDSTNDFLIQRFLGRLYQSLPSMPEHVDSSNYWFNLSIGNSTRSRNWKCLAKCHEGLGINYFRLMKYDSARKHYYRYLTISRTRGFKGEEAWAYFYLAELQSILGESDSLKINFEKGIEIKKEPPDNIALAMAELSYGKALLRMGEVSNSEVHALKSLNYGRQLSDGALIRSTLEFLNALYLSQNKLSNVVTNQTEIIRIQDSLNTSKFAEISLEYTKAIRDRQIQILKEREAESVKELDRQKFIRTILFISIIIAGFIIVFIFWILRNNKIKNRKLSEQNSLITSQREELQASLESLKEISLKLFQSEKMASLGLLTAGVAHEINNPLNFISGGTQSLEISLQQLFSKIMSDSNDMGIEETKQEIASIVKVINSGVERTAKIVSSLTDFSRTGNSVYAKISIQECLEPALTLLSYKSKALQVDIDVEYEERTFVEANSSELVQVFTNIIDNSLHAMESRIGPRNLSIKTWKELPWVIVQIRDNGTGIPEELLAKIFDPFFTTKAIGKGTGLGLSISYSIIEKHGGRIEVESREGVGTTFRVYLRGI